MPLLIWFINVAQENHAEAASRITDRTTERMKTAGAIVVTHSTRQLKLLCDAGAILENGRLTYYDDVEEAIAQHHANMGSDEDE